MFNMQRRIEEKEHKDSRGNRTQNALDKKGGMRYTHENALKEGFGMRVNMMRMGMRRRGPAFKAGTRWA